MSEPANPRNKRKRKKSFLKNARKYAKKGHFGRGTQLEADTYQYFVRIMEAFKEGFDNDEDKVLFVNNVFEQTIGEEIKCCCNQVGCRVIETLLPFSNDEVLGRFMKALGAEMRPLCADRFASHVVECLVKICGNRFMKKENEECKDFVLKVSRFLLNNLEDFIWDTYGSHVIRTCLETLSQCDSFQSTVIDYAERIMTWPQFADLSSTETSSGFLQILLKTLKEVDKKLLKKLLEMLLTQNFAPKPVDDDKLPNVFLSKPATMVLETAIDVAKTKILTKIYLGCFAGKLVKLATTRSTNFAVQKLVANCKEKSEFELIFDELAGNFGDIICSGHTGIIWALGQACKNLATRQGIFLQNLMKSLNCWEEQREVEFIFCLSKFMTYEDLSKWDRSGLQKEKLNLHGTLTLQILLEFNKPIRIVNGLLNMEQNDLIGLFANTMGSHIVDSFVKSTFVGEKSREKLIRKMKGTYQDLASTKFGSRSFEALWNAANLKNKTGIMDELCYKDGAWSNSEFGKIIAFKINLGLYKRNKEEWKNSLNSVNKANELFSEILK